MADRIVRSQAVNELLFEGATPLPIKTSFASGCTSAATEIQLVAGVTGKRLGVVWLSITAAGARGVCSVYSGTAGGSTSTIIGNFPMGVDVPYEVCPFAGVVYFKSVAGEGLVLKYLVGTVATTSFDASVLYVEMDN